MLTVGPAPDRYPNTDPTPTTQPTFSQTRQLRCNTDTCTDQIANRRGTTIAVPPCARKHGANQITVHKIEHEHRDVQRDVTHDRRWRTRHVGTHLAFLAQARADYIRTHMCENGKYKVRVPTIGVYMTIVWCTFGCVEVGVSKKGGLVNQYNQTQVDTRITHILA